MDGQLATAATVVAHTRAWRAGHAPKPKFTATTAFRYAGDFRVDMPVGLVIAGREKYEPGAVRRWLDWMPRFSEGDLRLGVMGGAIRGDNLDELARMAAFSPLGFTVVDTRKHRVAWLSERLPAQVREKSFGLWEVRFRRVKDTSLPPAVTVDEASERLAKVLRAARDLIRLDKRLAPWDPHLAQALATLASSEVPSSSIDILPVKGYSPAAHRLVLAVRQAWILGVVGSWTDTEPEDKTLARAHRKITAELYACLIEGVVAAVNDGLET